MLIPLLLSLIVANSHGQGLRGRDYRQDMRSFVQNIAAYGRQTKPNFIVIPQNGVSIVSSSDNARGANSAYLAAINGNGVEDLFYGYSQDNVATPAAARNELFKYLDILKQNGKAVLVTDYCSGARNVNSSRQQNWQRGYVSFQANHRDLDVIPTYPTVPWNTNSNNVVTLAQAQNFLYLINPQGYRNKAAFLSALRNTDYDLLIIDAYYGENMLTAQEVQSLKQKKNGARRLVVSYISIGEAETYRYYWQSNWRAGQPSWMSAENPNWEGNYKVQYWNPAWQAIIFGNQNSYVAKIVAADFDGIYMDIIDAYEYFEDQ